MNPLRHVAIIMDGNGRWGLKNKNSRNAGHREGLNTVEEIIKESIKNKIKFLTLFTFSTENWKRPKKEINFLFNLLENFLLNELISFFVKYIFWESSLSTNASNISALIELKSLSLKKCSLVIF